METEKQRIEELVKQLNAASAAYYNGQDEIMPNYEWDALFDELTTLEEKTGYIIKDSPTQNAGYEESGSGQKEPHEYPALSLAKTKQVEELQQWAGVYPIWLSWKLDGLTLVLTYDNGNLVKILTRGNGNLGTNITFLKGAIGGFPQKISYQGHLVVRGEAAISYTDFAQINDMIEDDDEKYANPRNLASGTLNLEDPAEVKARHVRFHAFTLVHLDEPMVSWGERMHFLEELGFDVVDREATTAQKLPEAIDRWTKLVENGKMDIPVDGLVICYDDTDYAASGSVTGHHATRAGFAFKWQDEAVDTKLKYIEWSCAVSTISPVAVFEPVQIEGTTVSRASLCNISEIERLGIGKECTLSVIKANKIIPKCIAVKDAVGAPEIPSQCPVCHAPTKVHVSENSGTKTLHCTNPDFVFLFNLCKFLLMLLQCLFLFRYTTCLNCIIILVKIIFEIIFCFPDQFCDLVFVLCLYRFCLFKLLLAGCNLRIFFPFGKCFISFYVFDSALVHNNFCRTIFSEFINLFLYFSDIFLNRLTQCFFLLRCKNLAICHICPPCL